MKATLNQLSDWTGHDRRTIKKRLEGLPFIDNGNAGHVYDSALALKRIYLGEPNPTGDLDPQQERAALDAAHRRLAEIEIAKREGELVETGLVQAHWCDMAARVRSKLLNLPNRIATETAAMTDYATIERSAKSLIHETLSELAANGTPR